jgi:hypothetical protein
MLTGPDHLKSEKGIQNDWNQLQRKSEPDSAGTSNFTLSTGSAPGPLMPGSLGVSLEVWVSLSQAIGLSTQCRWKVVFLTT